MRKNSAYFLLDAVLAVLILSLLLSAILFSLQLSVRGFKRINSQLYVDYLLEEVFTQAVVCKLYKDIKDFPIEGDKETPYGKFNWEASWEELNKDLFKLRVRVKRGEKLYSRNSLLFLK
jgi:hypothetical protein